MSKPRVLKGDKLLTNSDSGGIINIEVDELTPCLRRVKDNTLVDTSVERINPKKENLKDWEFDWTLPEKTGHTVYAVKADGDLRIQGLVALRSDPKNFAFHIDIIEAAPFNNPHNKNFIQKEYTGVGGHLFAEAIRQSYEAGFDGAIYFTAKSDLIDYYHNEFGAILTNPRLRIMLIEGKKAKELFDIYYGGKQL